MKIAVQAILFNAQSFQPDGMLQKWLEQADNIGDAVFITEGATRAENHYFDGNAAAFTKDGRSTDNTVGIVRDFIKDRPKFHFKEADGFWDGKTSMLNYWMKDGSPLHDFDYVWQIDCDEFYKDEDIVFVKSVLDGIKPDRIDFFANHFWGDFWHCIDERCDGTWGNDIPWSRVFKNTHLWASHEPPRMANASNKVISKYATLQAGLKMYHYGYVSDRQINFKHVFYGNSEKLRLWQEWKRNKDTIIFSSRSLPFVGSHPRLICDLLDNIPL